MREMFLIFFHFFSHQPDRPSRRPVRQSPQPSIERSVLKNQPTV